MGAVLSTRYPVPYRGAMVPQPQLPDGRVRSRAWVGLGRVRAGVRVGGASEEATVVLIHTSALETGKVFRCACNLF